MARFLSEACDFVFDAAKKNEWLRNGLKCPF
jgi:hypothetical protein